MIIIAFFFLLLPGEYIGIKSDSSPFRLSDVTFSVVHMVFDTSTDTNNDLAVFLSGEGKDKEGGGGEVIVGGS